jgi:hypothetical protein
MGPSMLLRLWAKTTSGGEPVRPHLSGREKSQAAAPLACGRTSQPSRFR